MTTRVDITSPSPNHHQVEVTIEATQADGRYAPAFPPHVIPEGSTETFYLHGTNRLYIAERVTPPEPAPEPAPVAEPVAAATPAAPPGPA